MAEKSEKVGVVVSDAMQKSCVVAVEWQVRHGLSLDAGWRIARGDSTTLREFRAGFTWAIPLKPGGEPLRTGPPSLPRWRPQA